MIRIGFDDSKTFSWYPLPQGIKESNYSFMSFSQPLSFRYDKEASTWAWEYQKWWINYFITKGLKP
jgi:hypothetical protein